MTESPYLESVDWAKWHVFWVDERVVPKDHEDSNYKLAFDSFLSKVLNFVLLEQYLAKRKLLTVTSLLILQFLSFMIAALVFSLNGCKWNASSTVLAWIACPVFENRFKLDGYYLYIEG